MTGKRLLGILLAGCFVFAAVLAAGETEEQEAAVWTEANRATGTLAQSGDFEAAFKNAQKVLGQARTLWGLKHPNTAKAMNNLANLYVQAGELDLAEELYQKTLAIERTQPNLQEQAAGSYFNLAMIRKAQGDLEAAAHFLSQAKMALGSGKSSSDLDSTRIDRELAALAHVKRS
ncbi:MAG: hypothetical protein A2Y02_03580 [Omnitrophica bacterium GWA2_52_12]|nr:MAG: hypothetical protein A2Y02_03580 [Omnitrophica bacterium GWA2_52_12]